MEEVIIDLLKKHPFSESELTYLLQVDVKEILQQMLLAGKIVFYHRQYNLPEKLKAIKAKIVSIKDNFAFAKISEEEDAYIDEDDLHGALIDDDVFIKKIPGNRRLSYEVISIIKRNKETLVGEIRIIKGMFILDVKGVSTINHDFIIKDSSISLIPHSIVLARIVKYHDRYTIVEPFELLGYKNEPGVDVLRIIHEHDAPIEFPESVIEQVKSIPNVVKEKDLANRTSFLDHVIVTIDGDDAKDFDDAVEVTKDESGYHVGVHIADVSYYVEQNSPLDKEAELRSTSIYCVNKVIPMLPFELSNGICSLNPHVLRLVQSVTFDMDFKGNIISYKLHKGYIKSSARLTYNYVNNVLNEQKIDESFPSEVNKMIPLLKEVADLIRKKREKAGCLDLVSTELIFDIAEDEKINGVRKRKQDVGELLIEDLMIQANELVTLEANKKMIPFIYRIHEYPKIKRMQEFTRLSKVLGHYCDFDVFNVTPKELQLHMKSVFNEEKKAILSHYLLRALAKARYSHVNKGHFGLALENYTHFTSPIRRYPDLIVHRLLDYFVFNIGKEKDILELVKKLEYLGETTSIRERKAQSIEREVDDLYATKYMSQFVGQTFDATVISLNAAMMFVELENGIEGSVPFDYLNEYFIYNESTFTIVSSKNTRIKLGDKIKVILESCHEESAQIIFSLPISKKNNTIKKERKNRGRKSKSHHK